MPFEGKPQVFSASIGETVIGTGDKAITLGGENVCPLYSFDEQIKNAPAIGIEISDKGIASDIPGIAKFYEGASTLGELAKRASEAEGASFVSLLLESADPNGDDEPIEDSVAKAKEVADAIDVPLVIQGSNNAEKDSQLLAKVAEALEGKNVLLLSATEENYKGLAVGAIQAYNQKLGAESAVDINLAKQLDVVITKLGIGNENLVMQVGTAAAGYGFEYLASAMDRIKGAALTQNDTNLQVPIITPVATDAWGVKESIASEADFPEWGSQEERGIGMEISTATACLTSGSNAVIVKHPESVKTLAKFVSEII